MKTDFFLKIINNRPPCLFVSPHLDDAAFSAGALISWLAQKEVPVTVVNVFTATSPGPQTLSARVFLSQCGYANQDKLISDRKSEDKKVYSSLGVKVISLDFVDALWRKRPNTKSFIPELNHVYPTFRWHIARGRVSPLDQPMIDRLTGTLAKYALPKGTLVFTPLAIGNHVDHVIVRDVCLEISPDCIFWSDFPYVLHSSPDEHFLRKYQLEKREFAQNLSAKRQLILGYPSQIKQIFKNAAVPILADTYYVKA